MTSQIAAYVFVAFVVAVAIGALGLVILTTHDIRRTIRRGIRDRLPLVAANRRTVAASGWGSFDG